MNQNYGTKLDLDLDLNWLLAFELFKIVNKQKIRTIFIDNQNRCNMYFFLKVDVE